MSSLKLSLRPRLFALLPLVLFLGAMLSPCSAPAAVRHRPAKAAHAHGKAARVKHAAVYVPRHAAHGSARLVRASYSNRRHHLHTARRLHSARHHGTAAMQAAAREAQMEAANNESPADQPSESASLNLPQTAVRVMNLPPMRGSHESLVRQNTRAEAEGLARVRDDADIVALLHNGLLVSLPATSGMHSDPRLPENRRYCRPWTASFLADLSRAHYERFHTALQINSAVRTVEYQRHLLHVNGNAAPAEGDIASPHLTGATIDIGKKGMRSAEVAWMRSYLSPIESNGKIDVEEEFHQSCFHISVYQSYAKPAQPKTVASSVPVRSTAFLATRLR